MFTREQFLALAARVDNLQEAGLQIVNVDVYLGMDNEMVVHIATTGTPKHPLPDRHATRFIVSQDANINN